MVNPGLKKNNNFQAAYINYSGSKLLGCQKMSSSVPQERFVGQLGTFTRPKKLSLRIRWYVLSERDWAPYIPIRSGWDWLFEKSYEFSGRFWILRV